MVTIVIPSLPTAHHVNDRVHWAVRAKAVEEARLQVLQAAQEAGAEGLMMTRVEIIVEFYLKSIARRDLDNLVVYSKGWLDGLCPPKVMGKNKRTVPGASVIQDDGIQHVYRISYEWFPSETGQPYTVIEIRPWEGQPKAPPAKPTGQRKRKMNPGLL